MVCREHCRGPASLLGGTISAGFGTLTNQPHEYGTHWDGFGARYGMRLTGVATSSAMEVRASWGDEDPRHYRAGANAHFGVRVGHIVKWTFVGAGPEWRSAAGLRALHSHIRE